MSIGTDIPDSWHECHLGEIIAYGTTQKAEPDEIPDDAWVLELEDIEKDTSRVLQQMTFKQRQSKSAKNRFSSGDVLYGKLRPYLNKVVRANRSGFCTTEILPLRSNDVVNGSYLFYWLKSPVFLDYVGQVSHGLNMPRLGMDAGRRAPFVLAPVNEQKRIVNKLDAILARVDACRERLDRVPAILKRFRKSVLAAATSGKLTEEWRLQRKVANGDRVIQLYDDSIRVPSSWSQSSVIGVIDPARPLCYGVVQPGEPREGGVPLIRVQDMEQGSVNVGDLRTVSTAIDSEYRRSRTKAGDLLISVVGTIGRTAIVPDGLEANIARAIARIVCRTGIKARWLNYWLSCDALQWFLLCSSREVARKTLNLSELSATPVAIPSSEEQTEIVRRVEALFAYADRIESRYTTARAQVERLAPALLAKAFRGELVPQDPNDEPAASVLLGRIRGSTGVDRDSMRRKSTGG